MHFSSGRIHNFALMLIALFVSMVVFTGCDGPLAPQPSPTPIVPTATHPPPTSTSIPASPTPIATATSTAIPAAQREWIPIYSYHHLRDWKKSDTKDERAYILSPDDLEAQLKWLKEEGYTGVDTQQVYEYYAFGRPLPPKPIMLSFDDNDDNQYTNAAPLLEKYGFKGVFFVMTVTIGQPNYMTEAQLKDLSVRGHDIQPHTWDHHMVTSYKTEEDWELQIKGPKETLTKIVGRDTPFFAYPFGIYDAESAEKLKSYGYKAAFKLSEIMDDEADPLFAIKRYIANGYWELDQFKLVTEGGWE